MRNSWQSKESSYLYADNIKETNDQNDIDTMGKFIDPFTDWGFKRIFGQEVKGKGRMNARQILNVGFTH